MVKTRTICGFIIILIVLAIVAIYWAMSAAFQGWPWRFPWPPEFPPFYLHFFK